MTDLSASTPEELVAEYKKLKDARQRLNTQSEQLTKQLTEIENKLIQYLVTTNQIGAKFTTGSINQAPIVAPSIEDWDAFATWLLANRALYLLHRRLSLTAFQELHAAGEQVPGIRFIPLTKIQIS